MFYTGKTLHTSFKISCLVYTLNKRGKFMKDMLDKIVQIEKRYVELGETLSDPNVIADYNKFRDLSKQRKSMEETVELYYAWKKAVDAID